MTQVPTITLSNTATRTEVWDMFWQIGSAMHFLETENLDFGNPKDPSNSSKNLQPHKITFAPNFKGHDHSLGGGRRIHPDGITKRNFDVNGAAVLWADYWNDELGGDTSVKYVVFPGTATFDSDFMPDGTSTAYGNAGTTRYVFLQTDPAVAVSNDQSNDSALDIYGTSDFDSTYWTQDTYEVISVIVTSVRSADLGGLLLQNVWVGKKGGAWLAATNVGGTADFTISYLVIARYVGPRDAT